MLLEALICKVDTTDEINNIISPVVRSLNLQGRYNMELFIIKSKTVVRSLNLQGRYNWLMFPQLLLVVVEDLNLQGRCNKKNIVK